MTKTFLINSTECYRDAEYKAKKYFETLNGYLETNEHLFQLLKDFHVWKKNHVNHSFFTFFSQKNGKPREEDYKKYIKWLDSSGKLDNYLDRSVSYIFMRDLGQALDSKEITDKIQRTVNKVKTHLLSVKDKNDFTYSMSSLYRWAQKEGIETTFIWLIYKLDRVKSNIPQGIDAEHAQRKLIKLIAGVVMHALLEMPSEISVEERRRKLDEAVRLGYSYGLTYPFIDDLLDSQVLSEVERQQYTDLLRTIILTGSVPEFTYWDGENLDLFQFIYTELREGFEYIKAYQSSDTLQPFFEESYVFFHSQDVDRKRGLTVSTYTNEELYVPVILKSASSRLIVKTLLGSNDDRGFNKRTFYYGIYNQLSDDFTDMFDDLKNGVVTPYTYYLTHCEKRTDLVNPFELYWVVIFYLIHHVYQSDEKACEVILDRAINGLKRLKKRVGLEKYEEIMDLFSPKNIDFNQMIQKMVRKAEDVEFFDKLLRDQITTILKKEKQEKDEFLSTIHSVRNEINSYLRIQDEQLVPFLDERITNAANYSLEGDGKRLRPIITWMMGVNEFGLDRKAIIPLLKSLEYMHTASLIFDDLPSQDDAGLRRGRQTLHQVYSFAIAELTGLFLTQKAVKEQASLEDFNPTLALKLIQYSAQVTQDMCKGQAMDIDSKGKPLNMEQLNTMSHYKTGIGFEASLIAPAILANLDESFMNALKTYALHAGIAFQIKDDLLDVEGIHSTLGKPAGIDGKNNNSTFVTVLGEEEARKVMWDHYCHAMEALNKIPMQTTFLKHLLSYIINRKF